MPKNVKGGSLGNFEHPFFCKIEKVKGDPLETFAEKKVSQSRKTCIKIFWSWAGLELKAEVTLVWQLVEANL